MNLQRRAAQRSTGRQWDRLESRQPPAARCLSRVAALALALAWRSWRVEVLAERQMWSVEGRMSSCSAIELQIGKSRGKKVGENAEVETAAWAGGHVSGQRSGCPQLAQVWPSVCFPRCGAMQTGGGAH